MNEIFYILNISNFGPSCLIEFQPKASTSKAHSNPKVTERSTSSKEAKGEVDENSELESQSEDDNLHSQSFHESHDINGKEMLNSLINNFRVKGMNFFFGLIL